MPFLCKNLYYDESMFNEYFEFLKEKIAKAESVSVVNFYLNEQETFAQAGIIQEKSNLKNIKEKKQDKMIFEILKYFLNMYGNCFSWKGQIKSHLNNCSEDIENNDELILRNFSKNQFERTINIVNKSIKFLKNKGKKDKNKDKYHESMNKTITLTCRI